MIRFAVASALAFCTSLCLAQITLPKQNQNPIGKVANYDLLLTNTKELNWRTNTKANFELKFLPRTGNKKVNATIAVWAFGNPKDEPKPALARGGGIGRGIQRKSGKIVYIKSLGAINSDAKFELDFSSFGPQPKFFLILSQAPKDLTPEQLAIYNLAKANEAANKSDAQEEISDNGSVEYTVQVTTDDGAASSWAKVKYGEPKPGSAVSNLEYQTIRPTPEFPEAQYGLSGMVMKDTSPLVFRWKTNATGKNAVVRVIDGKFKQGWGLWTKEGVELATTTIPLANNGWANFSVPGKDVLAKCKTGQISIQVTPLKNDGDMAGMPSNAVTLVLAKEAPKPTNQGSTKLTFTMDLVGWEPPYLGAPDDKYRFVIGGPVNPQIEGDVTKILGKKPVKGDSLYLPPKPPKEEDAWYKKVVKFIASVIDFISSVVDVITMNLPGMIEGFLKAGPEYLAKKAGYSQSEINKAWSAAETPFSVANDLMAPARAIQGAPDAFVGRMLDDMGVKDRKARQAMGGNFRGIIDEWAADNSYLAPKEGVMQGLARDPAYMVHTAIAYVRVRSSRVTGLPADYREPGPSISLKVGAYSGSASNLGVNLPYYELFDRTVKAPSMGSDEEIVVAIPLNYHWTHDSKYQTWFEGVSQGQKVLYTLNGKANFGELLFKKWGKTVH